MQREIKFRAWDLANNNWFQDGSGFALSWDATQIFDDNQREYCAETIVFQQFTGLKDKNGVEIYEDDVVKAWSQGSCATFQIKWRQEEVLLAGSFTLRGREEICGICQGRNTRKERNL